MIPAKLRTGRRPSYRREVRAWTLLAITLGAVEGALVGVIVKNVFAGTVAPLLLNIAVALVSGAPALANVFSLFWASVAHGRDKIRVLFWLQIACVVCAAVIGFAPVTAAGLLLIVTGVVGARIAWSGVVTTRSAVWRANYPRALRARVTGSIAVLVAIAMGGAGLVLAFAMEQNDEAFRWFYPLAALCGLLGALVYRRVRVRAHRSLLDAERAESVAGRLLSRGIAILREDALFRQYMTIMFVFGSGNLMVLALLIIVFTDELKLPQFEQMLIVSSVPLLVIPITTRLWARLLDRLHVIPYRAIHSWTFVVAIALLTAGAVTGLVALLWLGALAMGTAYAGGILGWNLGHNDFAPRELVAHYMGVHVTLTGVRGLVMPLVGVMFYEFVESRSPGNGAYALLLPLLLTTLGAFGFLAMARSGRHVGASRDPI